MELKGRKIFGVAGQKVKGEALVTTAGISFYGGVNPDTGIVVEKGHPIEGKSITGKVLVFPQGKGSTVGSYALYRMRKNGKEPLAIINRECETIVAVGAIISEIPCVDKVEIEKIKGGAMVEVDAEKGIVKLEG
ncbi:Uncharacterised protein [uncultured archaeon]|nr:Uncharacterised protein [uncultured archaeon]